MQTILRNKREVHSWHALIGPCAIMPTVSRLCMEKAGTARRSGPDIFFADQSLAGRSGFDLRQAQWARLLSFILGDDVWSKFPNVTRLVEEISSRPAAQRTLATLKGRAFKTEVDAETPQLHVRYLSEGGS